MSMSRTIRYGAVALAATALLAGCGVAHLSPTDLQDGVPPGKHGQLPNGKASRGKLPGGKLPGRTNAAGASDRTANGAPPVPAPLPTDGIVQNPCNALSRAQLDKIGLQEQGTLRQDKGIGPVCRWRSAAYPDFNTVDVGPMLPDKHGLSDIYAGKSQDAYFEPTRTAGYPAVFADRLADDRTDGDCSLWVGVTDRLSVSVTTRIGTGPNHTDPCPIAAKIGAAMVQHLKGRV
jgi:Protein of unknown function (DUF3558)